jgi:isovaleryl-CoA dehydrogenase
MDLTSSNLQNLRDAAEKIVAQYVIPNAAEQDEKGQWPAPAMQALQEAKLTGLHVPRALGGCGEGMLALATICEILGKGCASTAICFGMHCTATAVIAAKATEYQKEKYLRPIAAGKHLTTLALSEPESGSHFYLPLTTAERAGDNFLVNGSKHFVTNAQHADSYVMSVTGQGAGLGEFSCLVLDAATPGIEWKGHWNGFGMRANDSRSCLFKDSPVAVGNLLGSEGDQIWYVFEVVAPYFLMAMSGTYLGVAQAAVDLTIEHLKNRVHGHSGEALAQSPVLQHRLAEMWTAVEKSRRLIYDAAMRADLGDPNALVPLLTCKADIADTVVYVTNEALSLCGGLAYRDNSRLTRLLRDARASHVMSPTTELLKIWAGRTLLGLPMLG